MPTWTPPEAGVRCVALTVELPEGMTVFDESQYLEILSERLEKLLLQAPDSAEPMDTDEAMDLAEQYLEDTGMLDSPPRRDNGPWGFARDAILQNFRLREYLSLNLPCDGDPITPTPDD